MLFSKKIKIKLTNPCSESWDKMQQTKQGKFCDVCQKNVIDFSTMTDSTIKNYLKNNKKEACGRFSQEQLSKNYTLQNDITEKGIKQLFKYVLTFLITIKIVPEKLNAQTDTTEISTKDSVSTDESIALKNDTLTNDSAPICIDSIVVNTEQVSVNIDPISNIELVTIVYGTFYPGVIKDESTPRFLCKIKSIVQPFEKMITKTKEPATPQKKEPLPNNETVAILPESNELKKRIKKA